MNRILSHKSCPCCGNCTFIKSALLSLSHHVQIERYKKIADQLANFNHLNRMHYDPKRGQYLDWGNHTEDVRLDWRYVQVLSTCTVLSDFSKYSLGFQITLSVYAEIVLLGQGIIPLICNQS